MFIWFWSVHGHREIIYRLYNGHWATNEKLWREIKRAKSDFVLPGNRASSILPKLESAFWSAAQKNLSEHTTTRDKNTENKTNVQHHAWFASDADGKLLVPFPFRQHWGFFRLCFRLFKCPIKREMMRCSMPFDEIAIWEKASQSLCTKKSVF